MRFRLVRTLCAAAIAAMAFMWAISPQSLISAPAETKVSVETPPIKVSVGIPPLAYLVERIGAGQVSVNVLLVSGQDPHTYEPTPRQIVDLTQADLYYSVGLPFEERLIAKIRSLSAEFVVIDTTGAGFETELHLDSIHEHEDPHIWLSPTRLRAQARVIAGALISLDPESAGEYERNLLELCRDIDELDHRIGQMLAPYRGREFLVYHSALEHFATEYGLQQIAIESEGKAPGAKALTDMIEWAKASNIRAVFVQPQFDDSSARVIAEAVGATIILVDPLERDVFSNLQSIAEQLMEAMR